MVNIHVIGLNLFGGYDEMTIRIKKAIVEIGKGYEKASDITFWPGCHCITLAGEGKPEPYLVVSDSNIARGMEIAQALRAALNCAVEVNWLAAFLPRGSETVSGVGSEIIRLLTTQHQSGSEESDADADIVGTFKIVNYGGRAINGLRLSHVDCGDGDAEVKVEEGTGNYRDMAITCKTCGFCKTILSNPRQRQALMKLVLHEEAGTVFFEDGGLIWPSKIKFIK